MSKAAALAWANFMSSLGGAVPDIAVQYDENATKQDEILNQKLLQAGATNILRKMPQYGSPVLSDMAGGSPEEAVATLEKTPQKNLAQAADIARKVADNAPPYPEVGPALPSLAEPPKQGNVVEAIRPIIKDMESGGRYDIVHPKTLKGTQALGAYGIVPEIWFKEIGLDSSKEEDKKRFLSSPQLQDELFTKIAEKGLQATGGDPRKFRAWYYSGPKTAAALGTGQAWENKPQHAFVNGKMVAMPSIGADADAFAKRLEDSGIDTSQLVGATSPASQPWDNSLLESLVKDKPTMNVLPRKVTYGDQEKWILSHIKNPQQIAMLKDYIGAISGLAKQEQEQGKQDQERFDKQMGQYGENARAAADLRFKTWKEQQDQKEKAVTHRSEELSALKTERDSKQKQLADLREFQRRYDKGEPTETLVASYPDLFTTEDPSFLSTLIHGSDAERPAVMNKQKLGQRARDIEAEIRAIDERLSRKSGTGYTAPPPTGAAAISQYLKPRSK